MSYADNPIRAIEDEWLNRKGAVETLAGVLADPAIDTPLAVGIYGAWGSGKTSVMNLLRGRMEALSWDAEAESEGTRPAGEKPLQALTLWFDAWKYARQDTALWRALLLGVVDALGHQQEGLPPLLAGEAERTQLRKDLDELSASLYRSQTITEQGDLRVNWGAAVPFTVDLGLRIVTAGLWDNISKATGLHDRVRELTTFLTGDGDKKEDKEYVERAFKLIEREQATRYRDQVTSLEQFQRALKALVEKHIVQPKRRLFLFVDDLDRCLPEDAVGALEAIKLFLDLEGCVFVLGMDRSVVEQGIRVRYKEFELAGEKLKGPVDPRQYLDKIIQIPFHLPPLETRHMTGFVEDWCQRHQGEGAARSPELDYVLRCRKLIATGVAPNPRSVKRTVSVLRLMLKLRRVPDPETLSEAERQQAENLARRLAKLVVLQTSYEHIWREMIAVPERLKDLETEATGGARPSGAVQRLGGENGLRLKEMLAPGGAAPEPDAGFSRMNVEELRALVYGW